MTEPTPEFQEPQMPNEGEQPAGTVEENQDDRTDLERTADEEAAAAREARADDERQY